MLQNIKMRVRPSKRGLTLLNNKGFTLLETVIATFIVTVGIIGILIVSQDSVLIVYQARDRLTAAYLAKEGMEIVRNIRDDNWLQTPPRAWNAELTAGSHMASFNDRTLQSYVINTPLLINAGGFYNYASGGRTTKFTRRIIISSVPEVPGGNAIRVNVQVNWRDQSFSVEEILYNWR